MIEIANASMFTGAAVIVTLFAEALWHGCTYRD